MYKTIKIGIAKYDDEFDIPVDENMTLEDFNNALEKAIGSPIKLNIIKYNEKKYQKMKDFIKKSDHIFILDNENLGSFIKHWKGNFKNQNNSCFKDSNVQSLVHSVISHVVKKEEEQRLNKGLPISKDFKTYKKEGQKCC